MKKVSSIIAFCLFALAMQAQTTNEKFVKAMEKALAALAKAREANSTQKLVQN